jgi:hypothetical protein
MGSRQAAGRLPGGWGTVPTGHFRDGAGCRERNFPLPVVLLHGVFAVTTVTLVVIAVILRH